LQFSLQEASPDTFGYNLIYVCVCVCVCVYGWVDGCVGKLDFMTPPALTCVNKSGMVYWKLEYRFFHMRSL